MVKIKENKMNQNDIILEYGNNKRMEIREDGLIINNGRIISYDRDFFFFINDLIRENKKLREYEEQTKGLWCTDNINYIPKENQILFIKLRGIE